MSALENFPRTLLRKLSASSDKDPEARSYFINAQQVSEKLRINKAKLYLQLNHDQVSPGGEGHHQCS